jgi:N-acetylneuraminic acid mutarotase
LSIAPLYKGAIYSPESSTAQSEYPLPYIKQPTFNIGLACPSPNSDPPPIVFNLIWFSGSRCAGLSRNLDLVLSRNLDKNAFTAETRQHYRGKAIRKNAVLLLVLIFLTASLIIAAKPVSAAAPVENSWTLKAPMQKARANFGIAVVNGKIYAIGGDYGDLIGNAAPADTITFHTANTNEEYDPTSDTWTFRKPMPTARALLGVAVYQNKIYCIGGYYGEYFNTGANEVYDPATDTWETRAPMPSFETSATANVVNGKIYVMSANLNQAYDPETDSWKTKTPPPNNILSRVSAVVDDKIYLIGSQTYEMWVPTDIFVQIYDPSNDSWSVGAESQISIFETAVGATAGVFAPKRIYFFDETETHVYDPESDTWTVGAPMLSPRVLARVAVINDTCYVVGGRSGPHGYITIMKPSAVNEQYTPFGYGTIPPEVAIVSPETKTYNVTDVSLVFTVDKPVVWVGYSLDGQDNVTVADNITLSGLSNGLHNVTVYASDKFENIGTSEMITFNIEIPEPFPVASVAVASVATVAVVGVGLLVYFKKRNH